MNQKEQPRLASTLAQKVVDTIAPTINRNVNIMNAHGVIIASTDAARIGTRHEGSAEAISRNGIIRVSWNAARGQCPSDAERPAVRSCRRDRCSA